MTNTELTPEQWNRVQTFLSARSDVYVGQSAACQRFLQAVLWITRSGAQWRLLPQNYGDWNSVYKRFDRWSKRGVWAAMSWPNYGTSRAGPRSSISPLTPICKAS